MTGRRERMQAALVRAVLGGLHCLSPARASNLGGFVARHVGPLLPPSRVADTNLRRAMPELDAAARRRIVRAVWDNLGRTTAELPHLQDLRPTASGPGWEIVGVEHVAAMLQTGAQTLLFSGHFGNWEIMLPIAGAHGVRMSGVYRAASNRAVDAAILGFRTAANGPQVALYPKGAQGARAVLRHMEGGGSLGLLVDQKMNDGIAVPFFGIDAMTAPALAQFALRYDCPVVPARIVRLGPARLRMVLEAPLTVPRTGDRRADVLALMTAVNATLERWVRADPGTWLWLHRRWPKPPHDAGRDAGHHEG